MFSSSNLNSPSCNVFFIHSKRKSAHFLEMQFSLSGRHLCIPVLFWKKFYRQAFLHSSSQIPICLFHKIHFSRFQTCWRRTAFSGESKQIPMFLPLFLCQGKVKIIVAMLHISLRRCRMTISSAVGSITLINEAGSSILQ